MLGKKNVFGFLTDPAQNGLTLECFYFTASLTLQKWPETNTRT